MKTLLGILLLFQLSAQAANLKLQSANGKTEFKALGKPSSLRIDGQGTGPEGNLEFRQENGVWKSSGILRVQMKSFETGISLRDKHMKEKYLEVEKFETAELKVESLQLPPDFKSAAKKTSFPFQGSLNLHGVTQPVQGTVELLRDETGQFRFQASFALQLSQFGINVPSFAGVTVADEVQVTAINTFQEQEIL